MRFLQIKIKEEREIYFEKIEKQQLEIFKSNFLKNDIEEPKKEKHFKLYIYIYLHYKCSFSNLLDPFVCQ